MDDLLARNSAWAKGRTAEDPAYFVRIAAEHRPRAVFVGCSDARVPAEVLTASDLGELFVHRNVANQVLPTDTSLAAGLQYAVEVLEVKDIIVCGHYGCGGCRAALTETSLPHVDAWVSSLRMLARVHRDEIDGLDAVHRADRLVELNVDEQVEALSRHPSIRRAWEHGRPVRIHGWVFDMSTGFLRSRVRVDPRVEEALVAK
jgi:carbonic anhydrase